MPAAAVIPAPLAYINVVAVKKLVVGFVDVRGVPFWIQLPASSFWVESVWHYVVVQGMPIVYCEKISALQAGLRH